MREELKRGIESVSFEVLFDIGTYQFGSTQDIQPPYRKIHIGL